MSEFYKHATFINSIADLIRNEYTQREYEGIYDLIPHLTRDENYFRKIQVSKNGDKDRAIINLRNACYNELAFLDLSFGETQYKFIPWKTIQFYYSIFMGISAISRCTNNGPNISGHERMLNYFTDQLLRKNELSSNIFVEPFCFILNPDNTIEPSFESRITWSHGLKNKCPSIAQCLSETRTKPKRISLFHYFSHLRTWINYEDSYIFQRLYGEQLRPGFYWDMYCILSSFLSITEFYMIGVFGFDKILKEQKLLVSEYNQYFEPEIKYSLKTTRYIQNRFIYYNENQFFKY
jgi:hypothetical protein